MEIVPKNKAFLRGLGAKIKPSLNLGKSDIDDSFVRAFDCALEAHELVKIRVLQNNEEDFEKIITILQEKNQCGLVAITGNTILFYRPNYKKNPHIILPK